MSFEPDFLSLMKTTLTYKPFVSVNGWNEPSFSTAVTFPAHLTITEKIVRGNTEDEETSTAQFECPPPGFVVNGVATPTISAKDQIVMPDTTTRRIIKVDLQYDETGPHHQVVMLT